MIIVTGTVNVKDECFNEALALSLQHVRHSREEPGCVSHDVTQGVDSRNQLFFYEQWQDEASIKTHFALESSQQFVKKLSTLCITPPVLSMFNAEQIR